MLDPHEFYIQMHRFSNHVLIDVRTYGEFRKERITNAILARNSEELFRVSDTLDLEQPLFIYCDVESRSITACELLHDKGFKYLYILEEGIIGWKDRDLEMDESRLSRRDKNRKN